VANERIAQLPEGAPAQPGDLFPIARGTTNYALGISDVLGLSSPGPSLQVGGNTSGTTALITGGTAFFAGGNNVTLSQNSNSITISANTVAAANLSVSAGSTTGAFGGLTFSNSPTVTFGLNNGTITASAAGGAGQSTGGIYAAGNTTGQSSSSTFPQSSFNISAAGMISAGWSSNSLIISAPATTGLSQSIYATGNTTQSSSGTVSIGSLLVAGSGNVSVGMTNGSLLISGATAGAGGVGMGVSTFGNTAGSTGTLNSGTVVVVGSGPISLSQSTNTNGATISINGPPISSLSATGLASIVTNGSTISIGAAVPPLSFFQPLGPVMNTTVTQNGLGSVQVYPAMAAGPFTASRVDMLASVSAANLAVSTQAQTLSMYVGLYSLNGSTLSLASSGSQSYGWSNNSNGSSLSITGLRRFSAPMNVNYTGGFDLFVGIMSNTTFINTNGVSLSNVVIPLGPGPQLQGLIGQTQVNSMQFAPGQGFFSATSAGMPASMALSQLVGLGSGGSAVANYAPVQFANVTA